jgi:hypothetical protein
MAQIGAFRRHEIDNRGFAGLSFEFGFEERLTPSLARSV